MQSRQAAIAELQGEFVSAEAGYESSLWLLQSLLDDIMYEGGCIRDEDRTGIEEGKPRWPKIHAPSLIWAVITPVKARLEALRKKTETSTQPGSAGPP